MTLNKTVISLLIILCMLLTIPTTLHAEEIVDGIYIGWEPSPDISPDVKSDKWFHGHTLKVKGNKLYIETYPVWVKNGEITYSASDGAFYSYEGTIFSKNNKSYVKLKMISCDYCVRPINDDSKVEESKTIEIIMKNELSFVINNVLYIYQNPEGTN